MFQINSASGLIGVWDASLPPPMTPEGKEIDVGNLRERATSGNLFFVDAEDEVSYRVQLLVNSEPSPELDEVIEPRGTFRLQVPSGQICLGELPVKDGYERLPVEAGNYLLRPYTRRIFFDAAKHDLKMMTLVGESEWRYYRRVDKIGAIGCLFILIGLILLAIPFNRQFLLLILWVYSVPYWAYLVLSRLPRYRAVEAIRESYEKQLPHVVLVLQASATAAEIQGGWISVNLSAVQ